MSGYESPLLPLLATLIAAVAWGCSPTTEEDSDQPLDSDMSWEEEDDDDNEHAGDAEEVDVPWQNSVTISGSMSSCGYEGVEDWPWTGDNDNYRIEVPEEGYIEVILDWQSNSDLDLFIYFEPPGNTATPDWHSNSSYPEGPEEYLFDETLNRGDDIVVGVSCASGASDDYTLLVNWET
jgi:hypothetical protein